MTATRLWTLYHWFTAPLLGQNTRSHMTRKYKFEVAFDRSVTQTRTIRILWERISIMLHAGVFRQCFIFHTKLQVLFVAWSSALFISLLIVFWIINIISMHYACDKVNYPPSETSCGANLDRNKQNKAFHGKATRALLNWLLGSVFSISNLKQISISALSCALKMVLKRAQLFDWFLC